MKAVDSDPVDRQWAELLVAAQCGDRESYRVFLESIVPFARALARRHCWLEEPVEDVVQDVLLTVHRVRHTYEGGRPVKPWLAAIVRRRAIDAMRRQGRIARHETRDEAAYETFADGAANKPDRGDLARSLAPMLETLTPKQKEAIELVKLKEMSLAEASAVSGQSIASLKVNIHRGLKRMRRSHAEGSAE